MCTPRSKRRYQAQRETPASEWFVEFTRECLANGVMPESLSNVQRYGLDEIADPTNRPIRWREYMLMELYGQVREQSVDVVRPYEKAAEYRRALP
jgi:hypothetical protein